MRVVMTAILLTAAMAVTACTQSPKGDDPASTAYLPDFDLNPPTVGTSPVPAACGGVTAYCSAWNVRSVCEVQDSVAVWVDETCNDGCYAGKCSATLCSDECSIGDPNCNLWDMNASAYTSADEGNSMHDRARGYDSYLRNGMLAAGGIANVFYTTDQQTTIDGYGGLYDSAIWTGSQLAAEAWRAKETGARDAMDEIKSYVETLHRWFEISGDTGYMARYAAPESAGANLFGINCGEFNYHCDHNYSGEQWTWIGNTSRDQYTGVMLGYAMAYDATPDLAVRQMIREDVVSVVRELMTVHSQVPVTIIVNNFPIQENVDMENVILAPSEMINGRVEIDVDTANAAEATQRGSREFAPDLAPILTQVPALSFLPAIPRAGTAIMIGGFFNMAMHMTKNVEGYEDVHAEITAYYDDHADGWLDIAELWDFQKTCSGGYFAIHIAYIMAYVYATLEQDPARAQRIRDNVLEDRMWAKVSDHKNPYFATLYSATELVVDQTLMGDAITQLSRFEPGPRVHIGRDNLASYPHDPQCTQNGYPMSNGVAVDVGERVLSDFIWQRHPYGLQAFGNPRERMPGVDYQAAYWAMRAHGHLDEDRPGVCARWTD